MSEKQYYCDTLLEYRDYAIFDLSKADKNIENFKDEDGDIIIWQFDNYLVDETDSIMNGEDVCNILNNLDKENRKLKNELNLLKLNLKEKNEGFDKLHKMYMEQIEENEQLKEDIENLKITIEARETLIDVCEKKFKELGYIITVDDDGYVIE